MNRFILGVSCLTMKVACAVVVLTIALGSPVRASLIGDTVQFVRIQNGNPINSTSQQAIVGAGPEFADANGNVDIDLDGNSINIQFANVDVGFLTGTPNQFWQFSDLDWVNHPAGIITGVNVTFGGSIIEHGQNFFPGPFNASNVTFADHSVEVEVGGYTFNNAFVNIDLLTDHPVESESAIPEPSSMLIWSLIGLTLFGYRTRRR